MPLPLLLLLQLILLMVLNLPISILPTYIPPKNDPTSAYPNHLRLPVLRTEKGPRKGAATMLTKIRLAQRGSYGRRVQEGTTVGDGEGARGTEGRGWADGESGEE